MHRFRLVLSIAITFCCMSAPAFASVPSLRPLGFQLFDSSALTKDDSDEDWETPRQKKKRMSEEGIGKIDIDLKRPDTVVPGSATERGILVVLALLVGFGGTLLAIFLGGRDVVPGARVLPKFQKAKKNRTPRPTGSTKIASLSQQHYAILGVTPSASDEEIRSRFKHLVKSFHSDKLAGRDLPEEVLQLTEEQFLKVKQAYDYIRTTRNMQ